MHTFIMKFVLFVVFALFVFSVKGKTCLRRDIGKNYYTATSPQLYEVMGVGDLPESVDWTNFKGKNFLPPVVDQHAPKSCGSCFIQSARNAFTARYRYAAYQKDPTVVFDLDTPIPSVQDVLNCASCGGCDTGGDTGCVYDFWARKGAIDEGCSPYQAEDLQCSGINQGCYTCTWWFGGCVPLNNTKRFYVDQTGSVLGEQQMMTEIATRGPISCGVHDRVNEFFYLNQSKPLDYPCAGCDITHAISIVGYGVEDDGTKFWLGMNSWGTQWNLPLRGFFKLVRGDNTLNLEGSPCDWATVVLK